MITVLGFLFNPAKNKVVLIKEGEEPWNGIHGYVEEIDDDPLGAMERVICERAAVKLHRSKWLPFATLTNNEETCFVMLAVNWQYDIAQSFNSDEIEVFSLDELDNINLESKVKDHIQNALNMLKTVERVQDPKDMQFKYVKKDETDERSVD